MSATEYNLVSAGGDGVKSNVEKPLVKRTPVPSSRNLATRAQTKLAKNDNVKRKLQEALNQLSSPTPRKFPCKRAQTIAEITPSKRKPLLTNCRSSSKNVACVGSKSPSRKEDASRRVYHQLLLNAWRRRRVQVATLTDSSERLQTQVSQLQIQVNVLQKLRESESKKRLESASETQIIRQEKQTQEELVDKLRKARECLESEIANLQRRVEEVNANRTNIKNELLSTKGELSSCELKLQQACRNEAQLRQENQNLLDRIEDYKLTLNEQVDAIHGLELDLQSAEKDLNAANLKNSSLEKARSDLENILDKEKCDKDDIEQRYINARTREDKLEQKVFELKRSMNLLKEERKILFEDNVALKRTLENLEMSLKQEKDKSWWKNTAQFMLNTLHNTAYMMLPVYTEIADDSQAHTEENVNTIQ